MKITIDTNSKTIEVVGSVKLPELFDFLKNTLGENSLNEYVIVGKVEPLPYFYETYKNPLSPPYIVSDIAGAKTTIFNRL